MLRTGIDPCANRADLIRTEFGAVAGRHDFFSARFVDAAFDVFDEEGFLSVAGAHHDAGFAALEHFLMRAQQQMAVCIVRV